MTEVFFAGYGSWFFCNKRSGSTYAIMKMDTGGFILFPLHDKKAHERDNPMESIGFFNLTPKDDLTFQQTKSLKLVRKLTPSTRFHRANTITGITERVMFGGLLINAEDCYFLIDKKRPCVIELEFSALNEPSHTQQPKITKNDLRDECARKLINDDQELLNKRPREIKAILMQAHPDLFVSGYEDWWKKTKIFK